MIIHPYKLGSRSAKKLKDALRERSTPCWVFRRAPKSQMALVVNWGCSEFDFTWDDKKIVNDPMYTHKMSNKIEFFESCGHDPRVLTWTRNQDEALEWGTRVFCRTLVEASGGRGITVWNPEGADQPLPLAPLYTRYQPKTHEYRVHIGRSLRGEGFAPLLVQRKVFIKTEERPVPTDWAVRSHDNGFIFQAYQVTDDPKIPRGVIQSAIEVMHEHFSGIHFAALDVMYHSKTGVSHVIEGNTAPGLENQTVAVYADYFKALNREHKSL